MCPKPSDFPVRGSNALYGTYYGQRQTLLCGTKIDENACYTYDIGGMSWNLEGFAPMEEQTHASAAAWNSSWIIVGGQKHIGESPVLLNTSEILISNKFMPGPVAPVPLSDHCIVAVDKNVIFISGGYGEPSPLGITLILNFGELKSNWQTLNPMKSGRFGHACGRIKTIFDIYEIIVVGGLHQPSTEIYSFSREHWLSGPNFEDVQIFNAATVQGEYSFLITGGVELVPQCTTRNCRLDRIYAYDHSSRMFTKHEQRLNRGRGNHVSISLPANVNCSSELFPFFPKTKKIKLYFLHRNGKDTVCCGKFSTRNGCNSRNLGH